MTPIQLNAHLTPEQKKVVDLAKAWRFERYWDFQKRELDIAALDAAIGSMSAQEQALVAWLANLWLGENRFPLNAMDLASLDDPYRTIIAAWFKKPWWP